VVLAFVLARLELLQQALGQRLPLSVLTAVHADQQDVARTVGRQRAGVPARDDVDRFHARGEVLQARVAVAGERDHQDRDQRDDDLARQGRNVGRSRLLRRLTSRRPARRRTACATGGWSTRWVWPRWCSPRDR